MERGFYNHDRGGSVDKALPVMVRRITRQGEQARASANQIMEVGATTEVTAVSVHHLDEDHDRTQDHTEAL